MGEVNNFCPHCGSENVMALEVQFEFEDSELQFEIEDNKEESDGIEIYLEPDNILYYSCGECHSEWKPTGQPCIFGTA